MAPSKTLKTAVGSGTRPDCSTHFALPAGCSVRSPPRRKRESVGVRRHGSKSSTMTVTLKGQMSDIMGICPSVTPIRACCSLFQAHLLLCSEEVSFYAGGGKGKVRVHIYSTKPVKLTEPVIVPITEDAWLQRIPSHVTVPSSFYVFVERADQDRDALPRRGEAGPSLICEKPSEINPSPELDPPGDFLIRAYIVPEAHVGGPDKTTRLSRKPLTQ